MRHVLLRLQLLDKLERALGQAIFIDRFQLRLATEIWKDMLNLLPKIFLPGR